MEFHIKFLLIFITICLIPNCYAVEYPNRSETEAWQKPQAIIAPSTQEVIKGKNAMFSNLSKVEQSARSTISWSNKYSVDVKAKSDLSIDTSTLSLGKHAITLTVTDSKGFADSMTAILVILENSENQQNKADNKYFENLAKKIEKLNNPDRNTKTNSSLASKDSLAPPPTKEITQKFSHNIAKQQGGYQNQIAIEKESPIRIESDEKENKNSKALNMLVGLFFALFTITLTTWFFLYYKKSRYSCKPVITVSSQKSDMNPVIDRKTHEINNISIKFSSQLDMGKQQIFILPSKKISND